MRIRENGAGETANEPIPSCEPNANVLGMHTTQSAGLIAVGIPPNCEKQHADTTGKTGRKSELSITRQLPSARAPRGDIPGKSGRNSWLLITIAARTAIAA